MGSNHVMLNLFHPRPSKDCHPIDLPQERYGIRVTGVYHNLEMMLKVDEKLITRDWTDEDTTFEKIMHEKEQGGGLHGVAPDYHRIRAALIMDGKMIIQLQEEQEKLEREAKRQAAASKFERVRQTSNSATQV